MDHAFHDLTLFDYVSPALFALIFIAVMSLVPEPARQRFNAILVAGAGAAYLSSGFGPWEFAYTAVATVVAFLGLRSYRFIGLAWLMHAGWDLLHHLYGDPIIVFLPTSSLGCAIFDPVIAVWFFLGAPDVFAGWRRRTARP